MPDHAEPAFPTVPARPEIDPTVPQTGNNHGEADGYSGQEPGTYASPTPTEADAGAVRGGMPADRGSGPGAGQDASDIPPEAGHRATVDQRTGEVHGSGAGAGGGRAGEDLDDDTGGSNTGSRGDNPAG